MWKQSPDLDDAVIVRIDGLPCQPPENAPEHEKPKAAASALMQALFLEAGGGMVLQLIPSLAQALLQSPANELRNQWWLPPPQAATTGPGGEDGGEGGDGGDGGGEGGDGGGDGSSHA